MAGAVLTAGDVRLVVEAGTGVFDLLVESTAYTAPAASMTTRPRTRRILEDFFCLCVLLRTDIDPEAGWTLALGRGSCPT